MNDYPTIFSLSPFGEKTGSPNSLKKLKTSPMTPTSLSGSPRKSSSRSRRRCRLPSSSYNSYDSEMDFTFSSSSFEFSDSENSVLESIEDSPYPSPISPSPCELLLNIHHFKSHNEKESVEAKEQHKPSVFAIPEIVHKIIAFTDMQSTVIPHEATPIRRKPLSRRHALLLYGDSHEAEKAMSESYSSTREPEGTLYSCMQVNKLFYLVCKDIMSRKILFDDEKKFKNFLECVQSQDLHFKPTMIVLHRLYHAQQNSLEILKDRINFSAVTWIEFYMCPKILPPMDFIMRSASLKKLIITGSRVLDDAHMVMIAKYCPNLEVLDIRACELVTDSGIYHIAKGCRKLEHINFGRKNRGNTITDSSMNILIRNNRNLHTVGLAGCHISDRTLWCLATHCSTTLERLSLNNCPLITNLSIPLIFYSNFLTNLSVLELRFVPGISNFRPIIEFKRRQELRGSSFLLEMCEDLCLKMREQELEMDRRISKRIFKDIVEWVNDQDDGDVSYQEFLTLRDD